MRSSQSWAVLLQPLFLIRHFDTPPALSTSGARLHSLTLLLGNKELIRQPPGVKITTRQLPQVTFRPFDRTDFERLTSWVPTQQTLMQWCAAFFQHPLDQNQLQQYLDTACQANVRMIFTALDQQADPVGHSTTPQCEKCGLARYPPLLFQQRGHAGGCRSTRNPTC